MRCAVLSLVLFLILVPTPVRSQDVVRLDEGGTVAERYDRAVQTLDGNRPEAWVGFSVTRMMRESSVMGRFVGDWKSSPTIEELLDPPAVTETPSFEQVARQALNDIEKKESGTSEKMIPKLIAILLRQDADGRISDVAYTNVTMSFDAQDLPLFWLGHVDDGPAFDLLRDIYEQHRSDGSDIGEDLISAVGILNTPVVHAWLLNIVDSDRTTDEREQAVFWLGESEDTDIVRRLHALADEDRSEDVREAAVFALYRMKSEEAIDYLVRLAQEAEHEETEEKSRFWLAHKAGDRLTEGAEPDEPSELEKQAVFALSNLDGNEAITELSSVAKNHRNPHIRKQALFWLGQRGDDASLATIMEVLRGGE